MNLPGLAQDANEFSAITGRNALLGLGSFTDQSIGLLFLGHNQAIHPTVGKTVGPAIAEDPLGELLVAFKIDLSERGVDRIPANQSDGDGIRLEFPVNQIVEFIQPVLVGRRDRQGDSHGKVWEVRL